MIEQGVVDSFKFEVFFAIHDFDMDTFKVALYAPGANVNRGTTEYISAGEVSGTGYTAGGVDLTGVDVALSGGVAYVTFHDPEWPAATFSAQAALVYNSTKGNRAVAVIDMKTVQAPNNQTFRLRLPDATPDTAIVRIR